MKPEGLMLAADPAAGHLAGNLGTSGGAEVQQGLHSQATTPLERPVAHLCKRQPRLQLWPTPFPKFPIALSNSSLPLKANMRAQTARAPATFRVLQVRLRLGLRGACLNNTSRSTGGEA